MKPTLWRRHIHDNLTEIASRLWEAYNLTIVRFVAETTWNVVLEVAGRGSHGAAKVYNCDGARSVGCAVERIMELLRRLDVPSTVGIPVPIATLDGQLLVFQGQAPIAVTTWIDGAPPTPEHRRDVAEALACFHRAGPPAALAKEVEALPNAVLTFPPREWAKRHPAIWADVLNRPWVRGKAVERCLQEGQSLSSALMARFPRFFASNGTSLLHGDLRVANMLVAYGKVHFIDFDCMQMGSPEVDVAYAAMAVAGAEWIGDPYDEAAYSGFIADYRDAGGLVDSTLLHVATAWVVLRALANCFKEEQVRPRLDLARNLVRRP